MQSKRRSSLEDLAKSGSKLIIYKVQSFDHLSIFHFGLLTQTKNRNLIIFTLFSSGGGGPF